MYACTCAVVVAISRLVFFKLTQLPLCVSQSYSVPTNTIYHTIAELILIVITAPTDALFGLYFYFLERIVIIHS